MIRHLILYIFLLSILTSVLYGQTEYLPKKIYKAYRVEVAPVINGVFDDEAWQEGEWSGDFTQFQPYADRQPSQQTEFKVAFDDANLYIAIRAMDNASDSITNRMSRRDDADGDMVYILLDSYHDLRTAFVFGVSSAGVRFDGIQSNNGQTEDPSWDPIWQAKVWVNDWGWWAEMKIPFTQLRFKKNAEEVWGFEVARRIFRNNELSFWHPIPRNAPGFIHAMGELDGLQEVKPRKQFDLTPYGVGSLKTYEAEEGNPFSDGSDLNYNFGLDGKIGVTNNLTLDFTINPDFGQVEADPSVVNLSAFETFFEEKRPFFIEGSNITSFNVSTGGDEYGNDNLFYSRRIGRKPQRDPSPEEGEFSSVPIFTPILGAAKLTGKTEKGLSIGIVDAVTAETKATIGNADEERKETVEPLTNYSVVRIQKDFNKGNSMLGAAMTHTLRKLDGTGMEYLHKNASAAGIDYIQYFNERNYYINTSLYLSNVQGTTEAISNTQTSSARYFQRPDAHHVDVDSTRTSLSGIGGKLQFAKTGGHWMFGMVNVFMSPGLEFNDLGYMMTADKITTAVWTGYNFTEPFSIFRNLYLNNSVYMNHDFGGTLGGMGYNLNVNASFKNYWNGGFGGGVHANSISTGILRGGPSMYTPNNWRYFYRLFTDQRKAFSLGLNGNGGWGAEKSHSWNSYTLIATIRPMNTLSISLYPSYSINFQELQYITRIEMNGSDRYIFGRIDQKTLSMSIRINFNITPDLTIQYWGQPFIGSGDYTDFKMVTDPKADKFTDRYHIFTSQQISLVGDSYEIDEDTDMMMDYSFYNPTFTVNEWLSNLVIRWEFLPGSVAYLVWSQTRNYYIQDGSFDVWNTMDNMFTKKKATNTFLLKLSYRFGFR